MRTQSVVMAGVVYVSAAALAGGCAGPDKRALSAPEPVEPSSMFIDVPPTSPLAMAVMAVLNTAQAPFQGTLTLKPPECKTANGLGADLVLDYWFKFQALGGEETEWAFWAHPTKGSVGNIVPSVQVPFCIDGEPVYKLTKGQVVLTGARPVARGPRGRAGAPGTWIGLAIDPTNGLEYYYLLSVKAGDKLLVQSAWLDGTPDDDLVNYPEADGKQYYIEVNPGTGKLEKRELVAGSDRELERNTLKQLASDCEHPPKSKYSEQLANAMWAWYLSHVDRNATQNDDRVPKAK